MADLKISALPSATTPVAGTEVLPIVQSSTTKKVSISDLTAGRAVAASSFAGSGATVTTSSPVLSLSQTWNASAVAFTGVLFNATGTSDANSASASLLLDLQVGGSSRLSITKTGSIRGYAADLNINPSDSGYPVNLNSNMLVYGSGGIYQVVLNAAALFKIGSDLTLARDAAGVIGLRGANTTTAAAMSFYTYGASPPAAPAASIVRLYADTSGGKIRLMAIFPTGVAQQIAIEP